MAQSETKMVVKSQQTFLKVLNFIEREVAVIHTCLSMINDTVNADTL